MHKFGRVRCGDQVVVSTLEFVLMGRRIACRCFSGANFDNHVLPTQLTPDNHNKQSAGAGCFSSENPSTLKSVFGLLKKLVPQISMA